MTTSRLPFEETPRGPFSLAILHESPAPLTRLNPAVPAELERIVNKALEKDRRLRYQTALDMLTDLKRLKRDLGSGSRPRPAQAGIVKPADEMDAIAVLPFENASGDPHADKFLSDGITDSLINSLAQLGSLRVLARSTVFRYKGRAGDPQQSGRELKARVVLTGRVLLWGETLVIGAELVDVTNGWQLWGERYKRSLTDIFDVQEEIARVIVEKLRVKLSPVDERKLGEALHGRSRGVPALSEGPVLLEQMVARRIPNVRRGTFARPSRRTRTTRPRTPVLPISMRRHRTWDWSRPMTRYQRLRQPSRRRSRWTTRFHLPCSSTALQKMGYDWDMRAAEAAFSRAIEVGPNDARGYSGLGYTLAVQGRLVEGLKQSLRGAELEPFIPLSGPPMRGWSIAG